MSTPPLSQSHFYSPEQYEPCQSVGYLMRKVVESIRVQADARLAVHGVTAVQWVPLFLLLKSGRATVATLSREIEVDPGAITRALDRLEAKGLVQRQRCSDDRRVVYVILTEAGRAVAEQVPAVLAEVLNGHLCDFSMEEWQQLQHLLQRMLVNGRAWCQTLDAEAPDL